MIDTNATQRETPGVTIFGIGGAGATAVAGLTRRPACRTKVICADTDMQALQGVPAAHRLQLGRLLTAGLGGGERPELGRAAAEEAADAIAAALDDTALCVLATGLGGGTGTGAAPVIARAARARGILTIGVATLPFAFEGKRRMRTATAGAAALAACVDVMVTVRNQTLLDNAGEGATLRAAFDMSDAILCDSATDFALLLEAPLLKRVGLRELRTLLSESGHAAIGQGAACSGAERARAAVRSALGDPLLHGASGAPQRLLVTVAGGDDFTLSEAEDAIRTLRESLSPDTELLWGAAIDPALSGSVRVGIVAAGLPRPRRVATCAAPHRLPPAQGVAAKVAALGCQPKSAPTAPTTRAPKSPAQLALDLTVNPAPARLEPRVLAVVPRSAVTPSLADRLYGVARAAQRRWRSRPHRVPTIAKAPATFQILKPFDPPPRTALHVIDPFARIVGQRVVMA